jgi:4-hydroxyphenylpyruvate dioxygenase
MISEVKLYGDVVLRYVSGDFSGPYIAGMEAVAGKPLCYGLERLDHAVGNTHNLVETLEYVIGATGGGRLGVNQ